MAKEKIQLSISVDDIEFLKPLLHSLYLAMPHIRFAVDEMKAGAITDYGLYAAFSALIHDYNNFDDVFSLSEEFQE